MQMESKTGISYRSYQETRTIIMESRGHKVLKLVTIFNDLVQVGARNASKITMLVHKIQARLWSHQEEVFLHKVSKWWVAFSSLITGNLCHKLKVWVLRKMLQVSLSCFQTNRLGHSDSSLLSHNWTLTISLQETSRKRSPKIRKKIASIKLQVELKCSRDQISTNKIMLTTKEATWPILVAILHHKLKI